MLICASDAVILEILEICDIVESTSCFIFNHKQRGLLRCHFFCAYSVLRSRNEHSANHDLREAYAGLQICR